jgi:hypothetical protein
VIIHIVCRTTRVAVVDIVVFDQHVGADVIQIGPAWSSDLYARLGKIMYLVSSDDDFASADDPNAGCNVDNLAILDQDVRSARDNKALIRTGADQFCIGNDVVA